MLAAGIAAVACGRGAAVPGEWHQEAGYRWRALTVPGGAAGFRDIAGRRSGIRFTNTVSESALVRNRILGQGAGVALGDVDGDGRVDVFLARTEGCSALFRNLGGWRFADITAAAGVGACDRNSTGAALVDIDGDRDLDLVLVTTRGPNAIFVNDGQSRFTERRDLGLDPTGKGGTTITAGDVDGDGRLELYVANYKPYNLDDSIPPQQRAFNQMVRQVGPNKFEVAPEHRAEYKIVMRPDMGGLRLTVRGMPDDFYRNDGGRFTRVPLTSSRFRDAAGRALASEPESFTLAARFVDLNGDGAPDLYVANDFEDTDELWFNDGRGSFRLGDWRTQRVMSNSSMGVDFADVNADGRVDLFVTDMLANDTRRLRTQIPTHTALPKRPGDIESQLQMQRNTLFLNRGDSTFDEVGQRAGVQASGWSWGTLFMDVDLDGFQDILIANGHLWDIMDADVQENLQNRLQEIDFRRQRWEFPRLPLKNVAFRNRGDGTFEDAGARWRFGDQADIAHALAAADLDDDGDLDVVINRLDAPALVLRNESASPRLAVRLVGDTPNTQAVGAKITLLGGAQSVQVREVAAGGLYMSHSDYLASFAMGQSDSATIEVTWRDGRRSVIPGARANRLYEITPGAGSADPGAGRGAPGAGSREPRAPRLFVDATVELGGHVHKDAPFDDWEYQFLLPNSMSQLGPGVTWFDYDRDGDEDLLVGAGRSGSIGVFRNDRGRLSLQPSTMNEAADATTILGLPHGTSSRVIVGASSWELPSGPAVYEMVASRAGVSERASILIGPQASSTGPMALADIDLDGDLDLFVGGRALPARYPEPASSVLFRNEDGRFVPDSSPGTNLREVGLVSAAIFADVNDDGSPDLVLAREWNSILLLLNNNGQFVPAPASWGLGRWTSRWNGIAAGDLDGDGRLDLVATSWGRNTPTPADSASPLVLAYGSFGARGEIEMLLARDDPRLRGLAPLNSYARSRVAIRDLATRVKSFAAWADATVEHAIGPDVRDLRRTSIVTLDHTVFFNRGGRFEARPLPLESQAAPAFYVGIADFDGDGAEDVFLSQNFFPTAVGLPRYDAGRGLLMTGDGRGGLSPMAGAQSGILVYGDQRGAAYSDFDADGRLDLVVSQNSAVTRLLRNRGARPGLRVRLSGRAGNPDGVGARVRLVYGDTMGPAREIHAGSGYWSQNGAVQVFGLSGTPTAVHVRWPGGAESRVPVPRGAREVTIRQP